MTYCSEIEQASIGLLRLPRSILRSGALVLKRRSSAVLASRLLLKTGDGIKNTTSYLGLLTLMNSAAASSDVAWLAEYARNSCSCLTFHVEVASLPIR